MLEARLAALCDALVSSGWLSKQGRLYQATRDAERLLNRRSPGAMPAIAGFFHAPELLHAFATLADTIRGRRRSPLSPRFWKTFAVSTLPLRQLVAKEIARSLAKRTVGMDRIPDVGAGASPLGVELLRRHRRASLTALNRAGVVAIAARHAREADERQNHGADDH